MSSIREKPGVVEIDWEGFGGGGGRAVDGGGRARRSEGTETLNHKS